MTDTTVHLHDINNDETFPVYVRTEIIPRVGDEVYYWVDYPRHMTRKDRGMSPVEPGEPQRVTGIVDRVTIEYRKMDYGNSKNVTMVGVFLRDFTVTLYPEDPSYTLKEASTDG
jgi:hypothetical protein